MDTIGIVSILEDGPYKDVKNLWKLFERRYSSVGVQAFDHPHISFQGGKTDDLRQLIEAFREIVSKIRPFGIEVSGIGHFNKEVIYLRVEKTDGLIEISELVNQFVEEHCEDLFEHYIPENWIPPITLAMDDLAGDNFQEAWTELRSLDIRFTQSLHNICMVTWHPGGQIRVAQKYEL